MATTRVEDGHLVVKLEGLFEKAMAMRSELRIPLAHVTSVRAKPPELFDDTFIIRVFGASLVDTHLGYFWKKGEGMVFVDIHDLRGGNVVAFDLQHEKLKHLYVQSNEGETPEALAERVGAEILAAK